MASLNLKKTNKLGHCKNFGSVDELPIKQAEIEEHNMSTQVQVTNSGE